MLKTWETSGLLQLLSLGESPEGLENPDLAFPSPTAVRIAYARGRVDLVCIGESVRGQPWKLPGRFA